MRVIEYILGNSIEQTYSLHKIANTGLEVGEKGNMMANVNYDAEYLERIYGMPRTLANSFCENFERDLGPFATDKTGKTISYLFDTRIKICPKCIKSMRVPTYQQLLCFDHCLEHNLPLISDYPQCGRRLERRKSYPYLICCPLCNYNYGKNFTAADIIILAKKNMGSYMLEEKPAEDLAAWIVPSEESSKKYEELEGVSRFLKDYLLTGERGEPDRRLNKTNINENLSFDPIKRVESRIKRKLEKFPKDSDEYITLETMISLSKDNYYKMPPYTYQDITEIHWRIPDLGYKSNYNNESVNLSNMLEDMYEDAYFNALLPVVREVRFDGGPYKNILDLYPALRYTFIVFEVKNFYEVYGFFENVEVVNPYPTNMIDVIMSCERMFDIARFV